ncbi:MAG: DUF4209 domain-containing protein [Treponema sp.]|nr:DUF4209 domain-containing protein [Treponema sp.]
MENIILSREAFIQLQDKTECLHGDCKHLLILNEKLRHLDNSSFSDEEQKILELLTRVSSILLTDNSKKTFAPLLQTVNGGRTCVPEDFTDDELEFIRIILPDVANRLLKAFVADILWYRKYKKDVAYPKVVIEIYLSIQFEDDYFFENLNLWRRGLRLASQIRDNNSANEFAQKVYTYVTNTVFDNNARFLKLIELLRQFELCKNEAEQIIEMLVQFGAQLENNYFLAEQYYQEASLWAMQIQKDLEKHAEFQIKRVFAYIQQAEQDNSGISANVHYEKALKILRTLSKEQREKYFTSEKEAELIRKIKESGQASISEMKESVFSFDISNEIKYITDNIKGRDKDSALRNFTLLFGHIGFKKLEEDAINFVKASPLSALFPHTVYGKDGRVISKSSGIDFSEELNAQNKGVWNNMIWLYMIHISITVQTAILPALQVIRCEHNILLNDIMQIVQQSNLIPFDRIGIFAKGLMAGFSYDFTTSLHLLAPQIENMVRQELQNSRVRTSVITESGIEEEAGLSTLVEKDEFTKIFGKDWGFEIKALFCDESGPNLRNNVAHGLLSTQETQNIYSVYCWWFCFKLVYVQFANTVESRKNHIS